MAGASQLDSFVRKFRILWQSGCDAKLHVQSEAGNAFVTLSVGLGQVPPGHHHHGVHHRGGEPARQRRRERREAERQAAEKAVNDAKNVKTADAEKKDVTGNVIGKGTDTPNSPKPQLDGIFDDKLRDDKAHFELKVEAHERCTNSDVIEAIQENFFGTLDNKKVEKTDPVRQLIIREENEQLSKVQDKYRIAVRDNEIATEIMRLWNEPYEFDDLASKNPVYGEVKIKIKEVKRVR